MHRFSPMCSRFLTAAATCLTLLVASGTLAQEVVTSYADAVGSIIRRKVADGTFYYVVFGNRYLAQLRPADGSLVWVVDASIMIAYVRYPVLDLAVAGGSVFVCTNDPAGRIMKYRTSDGVLLWTIQAGVQSG